MIIAKNIEDARESIGFSNLQRSSVLNQSLLNQSFMSQFSGGDSNLNGAYGQLRGFTGREVIQGILKATGGRQSQQKPDV
jgi:hypothetical protein